MIVKHLHGKHLLSAMSSLRAFSRFLSIFLRSSPSLSSSVERPLSVVLDEVDGVRFLRFLFSRFGFRTFFSTGDCDPLYKSLN